MIKAFSSFPREITFTSVLIRMLCALLCAFVIGIERSSKNRPAGFRTHMLVGIGSAAASLTGHYLYLNMHLPADVTRIGAQIITGLGFIGAGTIVITRRQTVKGLTTAAGLWTTGIIGLSFGSGFYEGGFIATGMVFLIETVFAKLGHHIRHFPEFWINVSYIQKPTLDHILRYCKDRGIAITGLQIRANGSASESASGGFADDDQPALAAGPSMNEDRPALASDPSIYTASISLRPNSNIEYETLIEHIRVLDGVVHAQFIT